MRQLHAVVVGAGIGGMTAAAALRRRGWKVTVCERAPVLEPVGSAIVIAPNGLRALDAIDAGDPIRALAAIRGEVALRRPSGRRLSRTDADAFQRRFGGPMVVCLRSELAALLADRLPTDALHTSTTAVDVEPGDARHPARVQTESGDLEADLVVGADGIHSVLRARLFPGHPGPRYAGYTSWRGIVAPPSQPIEPGESWGQGQVFGTVPLVDGRVYWYATANTPSGVTLDDSRDELLRRFGGWHAPLPDLIASTPPEAILHLDIADMRVPLNAHHTGRVVLIGDAAHAMTPNLGQGGCQAIEDAVVLADLLAEARCEDIPRRLADYTAIRSPRTSALVRRSRRMGAAAQWSFPPLVLLRDIGISVSGRMVPHAALRIFDGVADWAPPHAQKDARR